MNWIFGALGIVVSAALLAGLPSPSSAVIINRIVATVEGDPITLYQLKRFARQTIRGREISGEDRNALIDGLVLNTIIGMEAEAKGIVVQDAEIDAYIGGIKERNRLDEMQLRQVLDAQGITYDDYREQIRLEVQRQRLIGMEIRGKANVTPEQIERYYEANKAEYRLPSEIEVAHIVFLLPEGAAAHEEIAVKAKADEARAQIADGLDFAEAAERYTEDGSGGEDGGVLGWFKPGELVESLEQAAEGLDVGEVSEPVRGPLGFHIIKLVDRKDETFTPLEELSDGIKEKLYAVALEERYGRWLTDELKPRYHVDVRN